MSDQMHSFLVELGTEELPPTALLMLMQSFADSLEKSLKELEVSYSHIRPFASPRRLALFVEGLPEATPIKDVMAWGPPAKIAFDKDGQPSKAAVAFASKNGVDVDQLQTENDGKIDKLVARSQAGGEPLTQLLPILVEQALAQLPISKRMRWGASRNEFVRPVHWLVMLWNEHVIPCSVLGLEAGRQTRGHRFHANRPLDLHQASDYAERLKTDGKVIAHFATRRELVREQVQAAGQQLGGEAVIDNDLLDEVTALVEWPVALAGNFESRFLQVPAEALVSSMKEHQKYFHVVGKDGQLLPHFITVANIESKDPAQVIAGNEKVIRPRLSDAAFFFSTDQKMTLAQHREKLRTVVFQAKLGTVFAKTERIAALSRHIATLLDANADLAERAGALCKADLATSMVYEFADMQGIAGYYYAKNDGEPEAIALAMSEQYLPKNAGDQLPQSQIGAVVALADRLDTLAGIFGLGQIPTGSKDPFALRRASVAVLRILVEKQLNLDLRELLTTAVGQFDNLPKGEESVELALNYMLERFRAWYEERNIPTVIYQAVSAKELTCPLDIDKRVHAVANFYQMPEAAALAAANKRVSNLLAKQEQQPQTVIDSNLLLEPAEQALAAQLQQLQAQVNPLFAKREYSQALAILAGLRQAVDRFFDDVMVMCEDQQLRNNRLALLLNLRNLFWEVADISYLAVSK